MADLSKTRTEPSRDLISRGNSGEPGLFNENTGMVNPSRTIPERPQPTNIKSSLLGLFGITPEQSKGTIGKISEDNPFVDWLNLSLTEAMAKENELMDSLAERFRTPNDPRGKVSWRAFLDNSEGNLQGQLTPEERQQILWAQEAIKYHPANYQYSPPTDPMAPPRESIEVRQQPIQQQYTPPAGISTETIQAISPSYSQYNPSNQAPAVNPMAMQRSQYQPSNLLGTKSYPQINQQRQTTTQQWEPRKSPSTYQGRGYLSGYRYR